MHMQSLRVLALALVTGVAALVFSGWASADPPSRVARLGYINGSVSFSPAGEEDWVRARINRPLITGDRLWAERGARSEIQVGGAMIRMNAGTGVSMLNLDDHITQLYLSEGTLNIRVRRLEHDQVLEVDTPNLAFTVRRAGSYRIEVDPDNDATTIFVRSGEGEVYGEDASYVIDARQAYRFYGYSLREYELVNVGRRDDFDRWANGRDRRYDNSISARYVSQDVVGYQDLDEYGSWRIDATYGNVWFPNRVVSGWAPYRDGHWAWVDPWGWTWIDDVPWGFAVTHYGRWNNFRGTWGWVPGPVRSRAYYAPALVVFVGGNNFRLSISSGSVGGVAWFPLAPREVYRPSYPVSRSYFENVNVSNTVINTTVINNTYNNVNITNINYANRQVPGAVVAVPTTTFVQSQPVSPAAQRVSREVIVRAPVAIAPSVAPTAESVRGADAQSEKPPARAFGRPVVARNAPPVAPVGFAAKQLQRADKPGKPLASTGRNEEKPAAAVNAPVVKVVAQPQAAPPTLRPPPAAPGARSGDDRRKANVRKSQEPPVRADGPVAPQNTRDVPVVGSPENRGMPEQRRNDEQRTNREPAKQPVAPPAPTQRADEPKASPAADTPATQSARPAEPRGNSGQRERPVAAPPVPAADSTRRAAEPKPFPPSDAPASPAAQQPVPEESSNVRDSKPDSDKPMGNKKGIDKQMTEEEKLQEEILLDEKLEAEERLREEQRIKEDYRVQ